jgi:hypothetical protein
MDLGIACPRTQNQESGPGGCKNLARGGDFDGPIFGFSLFLAGWRLGSSHEARVQTLN